MLFRLKTSTERTGDERKVQYMYNSDDDMHLRPRAEVWCNNVDEDGVVALRIPGAVAKRERIRTLKERLTREHESAAAAALPEEDSRTIRNTNTKRPLSNICSRQFDRFVGPVGSEYRDHDRSIQHGRGDCRLMKHSTGATERTEGIVIERAA